MKEIYYNRNKTVEYAREFAYKRNPKYYAFDNLGGDCTNFVSQCLFAGCETMNYTKTLGWYYISLNNRSPAWSGVEFLYNFLIQNKSVGPYGEITDKINILKGDVIELGSANGEFFHTLIVSETRNNEIFVASHNRDGFNIPLSVFSYARVRYIHILGARK